MSGDQLIVVKIKALPDMIPKTLEVKRLLARGEEKNSAQACRRVGISRSAYYKYKDEKYYDQAIRIKEFIISFYKKKNAYSQVSLQLEQLH